MSDCVECKVLFQQQCAFTHHLLFLWYIGSCDGVRLRLSTAAGGLLYLYYHRMKANVTNELARLARVNF
jgi:hypothetical protein